MKKLLLLILCSVSINVGANPAKATPEEEQAIFVGMTDMMNRLADPEWIKLINEKGDGCWLDKDNLVKEGAQIEFEGVKSTCIAWDSGIKDQKAYMFFPTRLKNICDKAGKPYIKCI
jgi:hypothetical protein